MTDRLKVTFFENGPYKLTGVSELRFAGEPQPIEDEAIFLCRCGQTKNPPYCDSSHRTVGFDDTNPEQKTRDVVVWEGRNLRTRFDPNTCMHVFACKPLKALREAELAGDDAAAAEIARVVDLCPSGALSWEAKTEVPEPDNGPRAQVDIIEGAEIRLSGAFELEADRGQATRLDRCTLCRCGLSRSKPFCDGRHKARSDFR